MGAGPTDPNRWLVVRGVLEAALEHPREARDSYLVRACGDDARMLAEARALLAEDDREDARFEPPHELLADLAEPVDTPAVETSGGRTSATAARGRFWVVAALTFALAGAIAVVFSASHGRRVAQRERDAAIEARDAAEALARRAGSVQREGPAQVSAHPTTDLEPLIEFVLDAHLAATGGADSGAAEQVARDGLELLDRFARDQALSPGKLRALSRGFLRIGERLDAVAPIERAVELGERSWSLDQGVASAYPLAQALLALGDRRAAEGLAGEAVRLHTRALEIARTLEGQRDPSPGHMYVVFLLHDRNRGAAMAAGDLDRALDHIDGAARAFRVAVQFFPELEPGRIAIIEAARVQLAGALAASGEPGLAKDLAAGVAARLAGVSEHGARELRSRALQLVR